MVHEDVERVLFSADRIERRVAELAAEVSRPREPGELLALGVLTGAFVFLADLLRRLDREVRVGFLKATSYRDGTRPGGLEVTAVGTPDPRGRHVLLVEDIVDTGRTLAGLQGWVRGRGARSLRTVVLLDKEERREVEVPVDLTGFAAPDEFLVGYGLDYAGRYRNLPYVGVLRRSVYGGG